LIIKYADRLYHTGICEEKQPAAISIDIFVIKKFYGFWYKNCIFTSAEPIIITKIQFADDMNPDKIYG